MNVITIATDFGYQDHYPGVMKGVILSINPEAIIVDITHGIKRHDVRHASYVLRAIIDYFKNAVHLFVVDPGVGTSRRGIVAKLDNGYFVGPDNGILTLVRHRVEEVWEITLQGKSTTFHGRDVFSPIAAYIDMGKFKYLKKTENFITYDLNEPKKINGKITAEIIHVDHFGNVITNVPAEMVRGVKKIKWKNFDLELKPSYGYAPKGELIALINSEDFLEFAVNQGSAQKKTGLNVGDKIEFEIY